MEDMRAMLAGTRAHDAGKERKGKERKQYAEQRRLRVLREGFMASKLARLSAKGPKWPLQAPLSSFEFLLLNARTSSPSLHMLLGKDSDSDNRRCGRQEDYKLSGALAGICSAPSTQWPSKHRESTERAKQMRWPHSSPVTLPFRVPPPTNSESNMTSRASS
eukprot:129122-Pelagomonas_calceolata.AAC.1